MTKTELPPLPEPERERFEAFHGPRKSKGVAHREAMFRRRPDGSYVCDSVQRHWWTWQNAIATLTEEVERLRAAANDAATSLETIARLAGRPTYGNPPIDSYMGEFHEVRGYATSRANAARAAIDSAMNTKGAKE